MKEKISKIIIVITISLAIAIFISGFIQALICDPLCSGNMNINVNNSKPFVSINNPLNITYTSSSILIDITATDPEGFLSSIWFDYGTGNQTYTDVTSILLENGAYTFIAYANDTANNVNLTSITFSITTPSGTPGITGEVTGTTGDKSITFSATTQSGTQGIIGRLTGAAIGVKQVAKGAPGFMGVVAILALILFGLKKRRAVGKESEDITVS